MPLKLLMQNSFCAGDSFADQTAYSRFYIKLLDGEYRRPKIIFNGERDIESPGCEAVRVQF